MEILKNSTTFTFKLDILGPNNQLFLSEKLHRLKLQQFEDPLYIFFFLSLIKSQDYDGYLKTVDDVSFL